MRGGGPGAASSAPASTRSSGEPGVEVRPWASHCSSSRVREASRDATCWTSGRARRGWPRAGRRRGAGARSPADSRATASRVTRLANLLVAGVLGRLGVVEGPEGGLLGGGVRRTGGRAGSVRVVGGAADRAASRRPPARRRSRRPSPRGGPRGARAAPPSAAARSCERRRGRGARGAGRGRGRRTWRVGRRPRRQVGQPGAEAPRRRSAAAPGDLASRDGGRRSRRAAAAVALDGAVDALPEVGGAVARRSRSSGRRSASAASRGRAALTRAAASTACSTAASSEGRSTKSRSRVAAARAAGRGCGVGGPVPGASRPGWRAGARAPRRRPGARRRGWLEPASTSADRAIRVAALGERSVDPGPSRDQRPSLLDGTRGPAPRPRPRGRRGHRPRPAPDRSGRPGRSTQPSRDPSVRRHRQVVDVPGRPGAGCRPVSLTRLTRSASGAVGGLGGAAQRQPPVAEPALDLLEAAGAEELLEQLVPLVGASPQEGLEAALGQHRDLGELGDVHARQPGHQVTGLVEPGGQGARQAPSTRSSMRDRGLLGGQAGAALLGALPRRGADDPEPATGQGRLEGHRRVRRRGRPGRSAAAWRCCGRRARRRTARSRRRRARWSCRRRWVRRAGRGRRSESWSKSTWTVLGERSERRDLELVEPHRARLRDQDVEVGVLAAGVAGVAEQRGLGRWSRECRAARRRSRARWRGRSDPGCGPAAWSCAHPDAGSKASTRVCGKRARSRSIACSGRGVVGEGRLHPGTLVRRRGAGSTSRSARAPRIRASGRGTGASTNSAAAEPVAPEVDQPGALDGGRPRRTSRPAGSRSSGPSSVSVCRPCRWPSAV